MTNVKPYTDTQIFERADFVTKGEFSKKRTKGLPLLVAVRSNEDEPDIFDDKFYLYSPTDEFILATSGTTNAGVEVLVNFERFNTKGAGVVKSDEFYPKGYKYGIHNNRMQALRQNSPFKYFRDNNRNRKSEQIGMIYHNVIWANFHGVSYNVDSDTTAKRIGSWSAACMVANDMKIYKKIIAYCKQFIAVDFVILQEW